MSNKKTNRSTIKNTEVIKNDVVEETTETITTSPVYGYVSNCEQLRIRKEADKNSEILMLVTKDTKVEIDETSSTNDFYFVKAYCPNSITCVGYCMKDFITIK